MQLLGIGFAKKNWDLLTKRLQKHISHQLNGKFFDGLPLDSDLEITTKEIFDFSDEIVKYKPDWILIYLKFFSNPDLCLKLLDEIKNRSEKIVSFVMVIDKFHQNINSFLKLLPNFKLVNKMEFTISESEILLNHHIKSFPRIKLDSEFQCVHYVNSLGKTVRLAPNEIPKNTIVSLKNIKKFETHSESFSPDKWIRKILLKKNRAEHPEQVVGIIREKKGCYFFPGVPFNSIQNIKFNSIKIEHLILLNECKFNNPPYKRFLENMTREHQIWLDDKKKNYGKIFLPIYCLVTKSIFKEILESFFGKTSHTNVKIFTEMSSAKVLLKKSVLWLKLEDFPDANISEVRIDWSKDLIEILLPIVNFVDLNELQMRGKLSFSPIHKSDLNKLKKNISGHENAVKKEMQQAEIDKMLFFQERDVLQKLASLTKMLIEALSNCRIWEDTLEKALEIKLPKILLLCEEESLAAELNLKLKKVQKILWINPMKFKKPEDLVQINSKMIHSYIKPETVVITPAAKIHLENLCQQTNRQYKKVKKVCNERNIVVKHSKNELNLLKKNKNDLALRWLNVSLRQLFYRDRHLFKNYF